MLSPTHFKRKAEKKAQKLSKKKERQSNPMKTAKAGTPTLKMTKKKTKSTMKGPVVVHLSGNRPSRDAANDRNQTPFSNKQEEKDYLRRRGAPRGTAEGHGASNKKGPNPSFGGSTLNNTNNSAKPRGASSQSQRRQVLKRKGDEDLLDHFRQKLNASTFRLLNEQIYNAPNAFASQLLRDASTFQDYHTGYRQQLIQWPVNPSELMVNALLGDRRGKFTSNKTKSMPGHIPPSWIIADMGCGEALVAQRLKPKGYTVHSFDFHGLNEHVTVADMMKTPLADSSVDVCLFSLSLMATDYEKALFESFRILKPNRLLKIIEVRSRVPHPHRFVELVESVGFVADHHEVVGDYFVAFDFLKKGEQKNPNENLAHAPGDVLVPSFYKKR